MSVEWNDIFRLPDAALEGARRVPKAALVRNAHLTRKQERGLSKVRNIEHMATVQRSTARIAPHVDDERDIRAVIFLRVEMGGASAAYAELAGIIHPCFSNPTVLLFENADEVCISASVTRMSLAERGATVVEDIECSGAISPDDSRYARFFDALAFEHLPQDDLYDYTSNLMWNIKLSRAIPQLGFFPQCAPAQTENLAALINRETQLVSARNAIAEQRRDRDLTLNETAKLRMKQHELERLIEKALEDIKALCAKGTIS